jgi:hypothetical protein
VQRFQKAIVGMTFDDIMKKSAQKLELRQQAMEAAATEAKARSAKSGSGAKAKAKTEPKASRN